MGAMSDRPQSEFNMAFSYLNRLNSLFYVCDEAAISLDANSWFHTLLAIFRELSTEMKKEEQIKYREVIKKINDMLARHNTNFHSGGSTGINQELYDELFDFELFLRKILDDAGLLKRVVEDPSRALSGQIS